MDPESDIDVGTRYLALSGRIWTVRNITPHPERFVLMRPSIDGDRGMIVDSAALSRMVRIEAANQTSQSRAVARVLRTTLIRVSMQPRTAA